MGVARETRAREISQEPAKSQESATTIETQEGLGGLMLQGKAAVVLRNRAGAWGAAAPTTAQTRHGFGLSQGESVAACLNAVTAADGQR